jgi:hypothetical protein
VVTVLRIFRRPKRWVYILAIIIIVILALLIFVNRMNSPYSQLKKTHDAMSKTAPVYKMQLELDPNAKVLKGIQDLHYTNNEDIELKQLYFHLYPNAFKTEADTPFPKEDMNLAYPGGFEPGQISIDNVSYAGGSIKYAENSTMLQVTLPEPVKPGESVDITISFTVRIPPSEGRFGYGNYAFNITNFYPILAVYDHEGWNLDSYYAIGDPFYSDTGLYEVTITVPKGYTVAHTGDLIKKVDIDSTTVYNIKTGLVRDFAWVASNRFREVTKRVGRTTVKSYAIDRADAKAALDVAAESIKIFNRLFGPYPYDNYCVVGTHFYIGGMEYPNLVLIGEDLYSGDALEYVVAHETAHQWWYGVVGSNQVDDAWIDEGLTEYSTVLYYETKYGKEAFDQIYNGNISARYELYRMEAGDHSQINRPVYRYKGWREYDALVYARSAMLFHSLREAMGDDKFFDFLKKYYIYFSYKNVVSGDFFEFLEAQAGRQYVELLNKGLVQDK